MQKLVVWLLSIATTWEAQDIPFPERTYPPMWAKIRLATMPGELAVLRG